MRDAAARRLGLVMGVGALYDFAFAVAILAFPDVAAGRMGLTLPDDRVYFQLDGVLLLLLAAIYMLPARDPDRFHPIAPVSATGRLLGLAFFVWAWSRGRPAAFLALGIGDGALGLLTLAAWRPLAARARPSD